MATESPPLTDDQKAFETVFSALLAPGTVVGFGRDKRGIYHAPYVRSGYELWLRAKQHERASCSLCRYVK